MKLGKLPAKIDGRTLRLESYAASGVLPGVPAARDWTSGLSNYDADPLGNDDVGDCTVAACGHAITLASQLAGLPSPVTAAGVLADYSAVTGYNPADPSTDRGAYLLDVLKHLRAPGVCGVRCEAFVSVAREHVEAAVDLFGGMIIGFQMPASIWDMGDTWDDKGDRNIAGGHAVFVHAVSPGLWVCNSWGRRYCITPAFVSAYMDEAWAILLADRPAPSGLDLSKLRADLALLE